MIELYIFTKESLIDPGFTHWEPSLGNAFKDYNLEIITGKIRSRSLDANFVKDLNEFLRNSPELSIFFKTLDSSVDIRVSERLHHILFYDSLTNILHIDSEIKAEFSPLYLYAFYYASLRKSKEQDFLYSRFYDFISKINESDLKKLLNFFEADKKTTKYYDAGAHLSNFIEIVLKNKKNKQNLTEIEEFTLVQILRNRSLTGAQVYDIETLEALYAKHLDDPFSGMASVGLFNSLTDTYSEERAKTYYKVLEKALKHLGSDLIAQRGSRVAHEQGPILINAGILKTSKLITEKLTIISKEIYQFYIKLSDEFKDALKNENPVSLSQKEEYFATAKLDLNIILDDLSFILKQSEIPRARILKAVNQLKKFIQEFSDTLTDFIYENIKQRSSYLKLVEALSNFDKNLHLKIFDLIELAEKTPAINKKSVVYVQRLSERSGHIIARVLLGKNLYVENDENSFKQRVLAIPYTFVTQDFIHIADKVDSFFENASISIVTDPETGTPSIKWQNAKDLAISLAEGLYTAIRNASAVNKVFHYQLETTLFGPLIDDFIRLLKDEISTYASAQKLSYELVLARKTYYKELILNAAELIFDLYQLQDDLDIQILKTKADKFSVILEILSTYRDAEKDTASLALIKHQSEDHFTYCKERYLQLKNNLDLSPSAKVSEYSNFLKGEIDYKLTKEFIETKIRYFDSSIYKELLSGADIERVIVETDRSIPADYYFNFTVAPSRIDFGKNVVSSVTNLMGRILGADDRESLNIGKNYIDLVSETENSFFDSSSSAGSAKVIENTCRAIQYSKAISFQGVFQSFNIDGYQVRDTINSRDNTKVGIHIMEHGTMASTGYCITKEPLFILHALNDNKPEHKRGAFFAELIKYSRIINETGIFQRIELMNKAIDAANSRNGTVKAYQDITIALNASYKGNVSDERENANQYLMALLLKQKRFIKNTSLAEIESFYYEQITNHELPKEIKVFDPYVDPDIFMSGEFKNIADDSLDKLSVELIKLEQPLNREQIIASLMTYGSQIEKWPLIKRNLEKTDESNAAQLLIKLREISPEIKYLETYKKGFYKNPLLAYQGVDIIQLNSDHTELISLLSNLVKLRILMKMRNPDSLLILVDNPQQAKKPFLDYDSTKEWLALGGTVASHMVAQSIYDKWAEEVEEEGTFAKLHIKFMLQKSLDESEAKIYESFFNETKKYIDLKKDLLKQKYQSAKKSSVSMRVLERYEHSICTLSKLEGMKDARLSDDDYWNHNLSFEQWLILGGRWVLNGESKENISYVSSLFKDFNERILKLYVQNEEPIFIESSSRIVKQAGSTKEADLISTDAFKSIDLRAKAKQENAFRIYKIEALNNFKEELNQYREIHHIMNLIPQYCAEYLELISSHAELKTKISQAAKLLALLEVFAKYLSGFVPEVLTLCSSFSIAQNESELKAEFINIFGDHQGSKGLFAKLADALKLKLGDEGLEIATSFVELAYYNFLVALSISVADHNLMINQLGIFFDQYLNIHEEDYPPYAFHRLSAGEVYGFDNEYYLSNKLREKMFKLSAASGANIYKLLWKLVSEYTVLQETSPTYRDLLIGDYENGLIHIGYQHQTICIEERFWDCMRALRNFVRNYHDRHPLPVIIKGDSARADLLFGLKSAQHKIIYIAGISSPGKHSWDLPLVLRSPVFREARADTLNRGTFTTITAFTPYLSEEGKIRQLYTSFKVEELFSKGIEFVAPFENSHEKFKLNEYGFVHALVLLEPSPGLPDPDITMSAHTHPQYISGLTQEIEVPEVWSYLSMRQMYAKTELAAILEKAQINALVQINFKQNRFKTKTELSLYIKEELARLNANHLDEWLLKSSKESGGRGISDRLNIRVDKEKILDFILEQSTTDDVVMQEFVPNNAKAFIEEAFYEQLVDSFLEAGLVINTEYPAPELFFAMRSFQSLTGVKGYLFSVNAGKVTVNAGQGAKLFYGEPILIMPPYFANKLQILLDHYGENILKKAIPEHAKEYARNNEMKVYNLEADFSNLFMLNGLFDYIPYLYVSREFSQNSQSAAPDGDSEEWINSDLKKFKVICEENCFGGLNYYYNFKGEKVILCSGKSQAESLIKLETLIKEVKAKNSSRIEKDIDLDLAVIELNSGLGQANLLQKALNVAVYQYGESRVDQFLFDEWVYDLAQAGFMFHKARHDS